MNKYSDYKQEVDGLQFIFLCWGQQVLLEYVKDVEKGEFIWKRPRQATSENREVLYTKEPSIPADVLENAVNHYRNRIEYRTWLER